MKYQNKVILYRVGVYITIASLVWLRAADRTETPQLHLDIAFLAAGHSVFGVAVVLMFMFWGGMDD